MCLKWFPNVWEGSAMFSNPTELFGRRVEMLTQRGATAWDKEGILMGCSPYLRVK
jgi:hypothetical protein